MSRHPHVITARRSTSSLPPLASGLLLTLAAIRLALLLATLGRYNWFRDEFYFIACGHHPAWGYVDQPPLTPMLAAVSFAISGKSVLLFRLLPALAHAALVALAGVMARRMGGGRFAQGLAALATLLAPVYLGNSTTLCIPAFDNLLWGLCVLLFLRATEDGHPRDWLGLGFTAGLALLNKQSAALFLAALFAGTVVSPARRQLRTPWPWLAAALAGVVCAPNLAWELRHHWPTLEFLRNAAGQKNVAMSPVEYFQSQFLMMDPLAFPLWLTGLVALLRSRRAAGGRAIGIGYLLLLAYFMSTHSKNYYLAPAYAPLLAAGSVALEGALARGAVRMLRPACFGLLALGGAFLVPLVLPVLPVEMYLSYARSIGFKDKNNERSRLGSLPQLYADMFGWQEMVAKVARAYHGLSPAERAHCTLFATNYGEAGAIDFYGPRYGLPHAVSGHNSYYLWGPGPRPADVVITIGQDPGDVALTYRQVALVDSTDNDLCMPFENHSPIVVGRGPKNTLREIWERCKHFI